MRSIDSMSIPQINFDFEPGKVTREKAVVVVVVVIVFVVVVVVVVVSLAQESYTAVTHLRCGCGNAFPKRYRKPFD